MVVLALIITALVSLLAGLAPARLGRRAVCRRDAAWAAVLWLGTWAFSLCAYHRPGLTVGFDRGPAPVGKAGRALRAAAAARGRRGHGTFYL